MSSTSELAIDNTANALSLAENISGNGVSGFGATITGNVTLSGPYTGGDATLGDAGPADTKITLSTCDVADFTTSSGTEMDGSTVTQSIKAPVIDGTNTIIIALTNHGDNACDSNVLSAGSSVQTIALTSENTVEMDPNTKITVDAVANDIDATKTSLTITKINSDAMTLGQPIILPADETVILTAISTVTNENDGDIDRDSFTYTVEDGAGATDADFIIINTPAEDTQNYIVEGTFDDNVIDSSFTGDAQGDLIDSLDHSDTPNDDSVIAGGESADTFGAGESEDVITFAQRDSINDGDDIFTLEGWGETTTGTINIDGGDKNTQPDDVCPTLETGDVLQLGDWANLSTLVQTSNGDGGFDGSGSLDDGTILNVTDIESVICFTLGTNIATPNGSRAIETLQVGDIVLTRDHGLQPIRWIQHRTVPATGHFAPVRLRPGVLTGLERDLLVSPHHRMLFQGYRSELLFGESEVLMPAIDLVDGKAVTREECGFVTYIHMMFDQHEVVYAEGAASESFHPGEIDLTGVTDKARDELFRLFPALRSDPKQYGQTARRTLKKHESQMLRTK